MDVGFSTIAKVSSGVGLVISVIVVVYFLSGSAIDKSEPTEVRAVRAGIHEEEQYKGIWARGIYDINQNIRSFFPGERTFAKTRARKVGPFDCTEKLWHGSHCAYVFFDLIPLSVTRHSKICCGDMCTQAEEGCCGDHCSAEEKSLDEINTLLRLKDEL